MHSGLQQESLLSRCRSWWAALPLLTRTVLGCCTTLYALCLFSGQDDYGLLCLSAEDIIQRFELYRMITAPLLHLSLLHVAFNMLAFVPIAASLERSHGTLQLFITLSALNLLGSATLFVGSYILAAWDISWLSSCAVGLSGVIFGLIVIDNAASGATERSVFGMFKLPAALYPWALLMLWQLLLPGVSFLGHLGGVVAGEALSRGLLGWVWPSQSNLQAWEGRIPCAWVSRITAYVPAHGDGLPVQQGPARQGMSWRWPEWPGWLTARRAYAPVPSAEPGASLPGSGMPGPARRAQQGVAGPHRPPDVTSSSGETQHVVEPNAASMAAAAAEKRAAKGSSQSRGSGLGP